MRHGQSVVRGRTHRLGLGWDTADKQCFWLEAGWLGDIRKAGYLDVKGVSNWQLGWVWLHVDGPKVTLGVVPVRQDGSFYYNGKEYRG